MSCNGLDKQLYHDEDKSTEPVHHIALNSNALENIVERCTVLENEMRVLQTKANKPLKIALTNAKEHMLSVMLLYKSILEYLCGIFISTLFVYYFALNFL